MRKNIIILTLIAALAMSGCAATNNSTDTAGTNTNIEAVDEVVSVEIDEAEEPEEVEDAENIEDTEDTEDTEAAEEEVAAEAEAVEETEDTETAETEITYTYTDLSATKYATAAVNVRSGPSTDFSAIGSYSKGATITVTGKCNETGWYRVNYKGTEGFVSNAYVSDTAPVTETTTNTVAETTTKTTETVSETKVTTSTYTVTDMDATKYATTALNVRSGPSTDYSSIGSYSKGTAITITGQCNETGWYRVNYNGSVGYVSNSYVSDTQPTTTTTSTSSSSSISTADLEAVAVTGITRFAAVWPTDYCGQFIGRLIIPDVGVNVAVYASGDQSVCDAKDSAGYMWWGSTYLIGDHNTQGFDVIANCTVGTIAYIYNGSVAYKYICTGVDTNGYNDTSLMTDSNGTEVRFLNSGGITLYTCNPGNKYGSDGITIAYFQPYTV